MLYSPTNTAPQFLSKLTPLLFRRDWLDSLSFPCMIWATVTSYMYRSYWLLTIYKTGVHCIPTKTIILKYPIYMSLLKVYTYSKRVVPKQSSLLTLLNSFNSSKKSSGLSDRYEVLSNRPAIQSYPRRDLLALLPPITLRSWWGESSKLTCKDFLGVWKGRNTWTQKRVSLRGSIIKK